MKVCSISDLHGNLIQYPSTYWKGLEECEILFICGDILPLQIQYNMKESKNWLISEFKLWAQDLPVEKVYFIAGNHDAWFERNELAARAIFSKADKVTYLKNEFVDHISIQDSKTYRIFGTPYCHIFGQWPFMRSEETLARVFNEIPENVDILITHDSPKLGTVGTILQENQFNTGIDAGNEILAEFILKKKPRYVFSGHIHSGNHNLEIIEEIQLANCSILNEQYKIYYNPLIVRV